MSDERVRIRLLTSDEHERLKAQEMREIGLLDADFTAPRGGITFDSPRRPDTQGDEPMTTIWKYQLPLAAPQFTLDVPVGAVRLHLDMQHGFPCLWVQVDPNAEKTTREIYVVGTGHAIPDGDLGHLGTVQINGYVWHYFEKLLPE